MANGDTVDELMLEWEAARQEGRKLTAEQLCAACPEHVDELRAMIRAVLKMENVLSVTLLESRAPESEGVDRRFEPLPAIPGYEVLRVIDRGGMGVVYEARDLELGRTVAIKMIAADRMSPKLVDRFQAEAEAAARVQHPNFVQIFEIGRVAGVPFYSMEYVAGGNLAELLSKQALSPRSAAEMTLTLAQAVQAAHECGIIHRDLKPANVMLTVDGTPKIADFGLAKRLDNDIGHTHTGEILGTPSYMAPEQAEGRRSAIGPRTDVYSLGAILYEMLSGQPPFVGASPLDSLRRVLAEDPVAPSRLAPSIPSDLEAICLKCLEKAPSRRYASAKALANDLRSFLEDRPVAARRSGPLRRAWKFAHRHPQTITLCAALAVLLLSIPAWVWWEQYFAEREIRRKAAVQASEVREILRRNCYACHGQEVRDVHKNLYILNHRQLLDSAHPIVVPGSPDDSLLIQRIADGSMPPEEEELHLPRVSEAELQILRDWILGGAPPFAPADAADAALAAPPRSDTAAAAKVIFENRCYECHKFDIARGGIKIMHHRLLVTVRKVVVPGQPEKSKLFQRLITDNDKLRMPPDQPHLPADEIETIRRWILDGAPPFPKD